MQGGLRRGAYGTVLPWGMVGARMVYNTSDLECRLTPQVFYTYFYNHANRANRPRLEKLLYIEPP